MGVQVALARLGTAAALSANLPMAKATSLGIQLPVIVGAALLIAGFLGFLVYNVMDRRLDASIAAVDGESVTEAAEDESFKFSDLGKSSPIPVSGSSPCSACSSTAACSPS